MISLGAWQLNFSHPLLVALSILLLISLLSSLRFVSKRLFKTRKLRFFLTAVLNLAAYAAVFVLLLQPAHLRLADETVILLTDGFDDEQSASFKTSKVYDLRSSANPASGYRQLTNIGQLPLREPGLVRIRVFGAGLSRSQWQDLPDDIFIEHEPQAIIGFTDMQWQKSIIAGESFRTSGRLHNHNRQGIVEIRLLDPTGEAVSSVRKSTEQAFDLITQPRAKGLLVYTLQAWLGNELLSEETLPVEVRDGAVMNIHIEQSAPSYETRQLKDFAALRGHRLSIHTQISKARYVSQASGSPTSRDFAFLPHNLARQDVLIIDAGALGKLDMNRNALLLDAIRDGLGVLILADSSLLEHSETPLLEGFSLNPLADAVPEATPRLLSAVSEAWQMPLPVAAIKIDTPGANILIDDGDGRTLVAWRSRGKGHIGISLLSHSDRWLRSGNRTQWGELWSAVLAVVARQPAKDSLLDFSGFQVPRVDQQTTICALASGQSLKVAIAPLNSGQPGSTVTALLAKDQLGSAKDCASFWPVSAGWHLVKLMPAVDGIMVDEKAVYVFGQGQWMADEHHKRQLDTRARVTANTADGASPQQKWVTQATGIFWPWLIVLLSASFLWLERKFFVHYPSVT